MLFTMCKTVLLPVPDEGLYKLRTAPVWLRNVSSRDPNPVKAAKDTGSVPGLPYSAQTSFHFSKLPLVCMCLAICLVALDGGV